MDNIIIYLTHPSEWDSEIQDKGWRNDIYVRVSGNIYNIEAYDIMRFNQEIQHDIETLGYGKFGPSIIIVKHLDISEIIEAIVGLHRSGYFQYLKPIDPDRNMESKFRRVN